MEQKFKMIRKEADGRLFPYSDILADSPGMVVVELTKEQIEKATGVPVQGQKAKQHRYREVFVRSSRRKSLVDVVTGKDSKPGPGWFKTQHGWKRKAA